MRWAFSSIHFGKVTGNREETALVGRWWFQMGPLQSEKWISDWKAGRCPLKFHPNMSIFHF